MEPPVESLADEVTRLREALRESERGSRLLLDSIPGLVALLAPDGQLQFVNRQILEYTGRTLDELKHWGTSDTVHSEDLPHVIQVFTRSIGSGSPYEIVQRLRRADGVYRWFQNNGFPLRDTSDRIVRWCVLLIDIDERKRAEDAIRASERQFRLLVETIPALVWRGTPEGELDYLNRRAVEYLGHTAESLTGGRWLELVHPDHRETTVQRWLQAATTGSSYADEYRLRRADGEYRWIRSVGEPLHDTDGRIANWYGLVIDIEDRKRAEAESRTAEEALNRARSELAHVARVTTVGALTASIAHEVNQPLSGILTNASTCLRMLAANPPDIEGARETARRTMRDGNRASDVITRLRALFTKKEFTLEPLDLNEVTREVVVLSLSELQRNRIVLESEFADDLPLITGDRIQLQQVMLNLLRNASDAMVGVRDRPRRLLLRTEREEGDGVRLTVRDAGVGVDPQSMNKLFDAFYTTKPDGMGIGLSVSRSIIERHHGRLWAEPNDGGPGATFSFWIPRQAERLDAVAAPSAS